MAREAQNGVDSRSGILQTPKELVETGQLPITTTIVVEPGTRP